MKTAAVLGLAVITFMGTGCASMFIHGGRLVNRNTSIQGASANYVATQCTNREGGIEQGPAATYHVLAGETGPELLERESSGAGVLISNRWSDSDGTHFFAWGAGNGWEYIVPPQGPAIRKVYRYPGAFDAPDGSHRPNPTEVPMFTCTLTPTTGA